MVVGCLYKVDFTKKTVISNVNYKVLGYRTIGISEG